MHERKLQMFERSDAFVVLPGGIGTLEELFEVLSWRTLGLHTKPIVIVDQGGYWQPSRSPSALGRGRRFRRTDPPRPCGLRERPRSRSCPQSPQCRARPAWNAPGPRLNSAPTIRWSPRLPDALPLPRGDATRRAIIRNRSTRPKRKRRTEVQVCQISKSSGRRSTKRPGLPRIPCCRSCEAFAAAAGVPSKLTRHLADGPHPGQRFPRT